MVVKLKKTAFVAIVLLSGLCAFAQSQWRWFNYKIEGRTKTVFSIFRDSKDRTWVGGNMGVCVFNGFESYPCTYGNDYFRAQVYDMAEAGDSIFLATNSGLFRMDPRTLEVDDIPVRTPLEIRKLDCHGDSLWLGSLNGLYVYDLRTGTIGGACAGLPHNAVYCLLRDRAGTLYVGTYDGLCRRTGNGFERVALQTGRLAGGNEFVNSLCFDSDSVLYVGLEGALLKYYPRTGRTERLGVCDDNSVKSLALLGRRVAAGTDNGLFIIEPDGTASVQRHNARLGYSIESNAVWTLLADGSDMLMAGTEMGLSIADINSPVQIFPLADLTGQNGGQQVYDIMRDSHGVLWLGGTNGIIAVGGSGSTWYFPGSAEHGLSHNRVRAITETSDGCLWVATDGGINVFDRASGKFVNHRIVDSERNVNANWAYSILEDPSDSTIWTAGYLGGVFVEKLDRFRREGTVHCPDTVFTVSGGLPNSLIGQMVSDGMGNKWVLHYRDSALTRIDARTRKLSHVSVSGLVGSEPMMLCTGAGGSVWCGAYGAVVRIEPDGSIDSRVVRLPFSDDSNITAMCGVGDSLWVATDGAVYAVDPSEMRARLLSMPSLGYSSMYFDRQTGRVVLGAMDEIVEVEPCRIETAGTPGPAGIFRIREAGRVVTYDLPDDGAQSVRLPNDNRDVEIDFGTQCFAPGRYLRFCYRLDDDAWRLLPESQNRISFTALSPGKHILEFAIAGQESSARVLVLKVARPWYSSVAAICVYVLLAGLLSASAVCYARRRHRRRIEELERQSALSSVDRRLTFLSNISHELKTPLSMIIGPLSRARGDDTPPKVRADIDTAYHNALKLNTLIHQTIEINRLDNDSDTMLIYSRVDVVEFCRDLAEAYRASHPDRNFVFSADETRLDVRVDVVKLESLLNNLFSNAVKYTPEGATVACSVRSAGTDFEIVGADDGVGIPEDEQALVFQRLYRSPRTSSSAEGTGIGLYLVRRYAELLGGSISLTSVPGEGTAFCLRLPVDDNSGDEAGLLKVPDPDNTDKRPRVLVVDDNRSVAAFVVSVLSDRFNCATAYNGRAGLTVAASFKPDIVIADEMMPVMSGLEMCRRLKANPATAATPILLLTAKDTPETHGQSLESGVDAFMAKPFETRALQTKVARLLDASEQLRKKLTFEALTHADAQTVPAESADEKRLASVTAVIENNISNPDLNVAFVCDKVGIASKSLYRLVKKYTGVSPLDYIRQTRLRKAAMLLEQAKFSVSEVMYMVGFSSSSYFSKCFAQQFGCTPGQYMARMPK